MLSPGDIRALYQTYSILPLDEISHNDIVTALEKEVKYKKHDETKAVGF